MLTPLEYTFIDLMPHREYFTWMIMHTVATCHANTSVVFLTNTHPRVFWSIWKLYIRCIYNIWRRVLFKRNSSCSSKMNKHNIKMSCHLYLRFYIYALVQGLTNHNHNMFNQSKQLFTVMVMSYYLFCCEATFFKIFSLRSTSIYFLL